MNEVEVKARAKNPEKLLEALADVGVKFNDPSLQHDTIYVDNDYDPKNPKLDRNILRLRSETGRNLLTLKRDGKNELDSLERETAIADAKSMHDILFFLGYKPFIEVKKYRRKARFNDIELCLDEVENLGMFIEVEKLTQEEDTEKIQEELFSFLLSLGVQEEDRVTQGYDTLVRLYNEGSMK
ncbi:MAG TPA: class IV adenylate cyclase [Patescibacteria group bacterium]